MPAHTSCNQMEALPTIKLYKFILDIHKQNQIKSKRQIHNNDENKNHEKRLSKKRVAFFVNE